jgi:hypothetical protein
MLGTGGDSSTLQKAIFCSYGVLVTAFGSIPEYPGSSAIVFAACQNGVFSVLKRGFALASLYSERRSRPAMALSRTLRLA